MSDESSPRVGVHSVERAFELLEILASCGGSMALSELATRAELPQPTIHRFARTLLTMGYLRQHDDRRYALGPKMVRLGASAAQLNGAWSRPYLAELVERTGESANMAVLDNDRAIYVAQVPSPHTMRMFTEVGRRVHLHCTGVGKGLLMQLPNDVVRTLMTRVGMPTSNQNSLTTPDALIRDIELSRSRGYAVDEGEQEIGVRCFAVPVPAAPTLTVISISGPAVRLTSTSATEVSELLKRVARDIATEFVKEERPATA
ncbi:IclR family transcriptional regulator [Mycobacterium sp. 852013-50091_SCH5140682]|uniref:IclR family transcriptional regulator n=1 Tax=Mycobacterium sp. 852013-50091_SCH5140682 TaxID=1834109 RepID=UPI0007E98621|nr:IclR family transcriptional regulator [Mycobacterium sp. 852013-50091_SCH5140682]OBC04667.1 IclR family transcriptional regulator [Mycobacterium sp. 852013-50091_SCH5140682]